MEPREMLRTLEAERARGLAAFERARTIEELDAAQTAVMGRRSPFSEVQRSLGGLDHEGWRRGRRGQRGAHSVAGPARRAT
ncbi:MAG: hypothetical protein U0V56_04830 [Actinomycetota bacterium]